MTITTQTIAPGLDVTAQLSPEHMADAAAQGFKTVINNRPDGEGGPSQPLNAAIEAAAHANGLTYIYLPVVTGAITPPQALAMRDALEAASYPVLAFCRTGTRCKQLFSLSQTAR